MWRVVLDTNVFVSAALWRGTTSQITQAIDRASVLVILTPLIVREYRRVLQRPKFQSVLSQRETTWAKLIHELSTRSIIVPDLPSPVPVPDDPSDEKFIAAAINARADAIVSGDRHLRALGEVAGIPILSPQLFLHRFKP